MKNKLYKSGLFVLTILLFIGMSGASSITVNYDNNIGESNEKTISNFPILNNDYINAFWEFDTGSGNTAYDSSGHDYDGTIDGASWSTDTPSGQGFSIEVDGIDDYVNLDSYSSNLGFNKTDDLIFSFSMKTSSNNKGMIYSTSTGYGTNPEFHIFIEENGTIGIKAEVTSCGFTFFTDDSYNDGNWYDIEVWFNGITNEPTVTIYVDNDPVASITHWVCPFEASDFTKTKIGRRSHNTTNYFDGKIDEMKIVKYPSGDEQEPPTIDGPTHGDPGVEYDYTFVTDDPEGDDIQLYIDWGDGTYEDWDEWYESGEEVIISHEWDEEGEYNITAKSRDVWDDSRWSNKYVVKIGNQPPYKPDISGRRYGSADEELTFTFVSEDYEGNDIKYFIDWNDGNTEWTDYFSSGEEVEVTHAWDSDGDYEITSYPVDDFDNKGKTSDPYIIRIGDQPPDPPTINGPKAGSPGIEYTFTFESSDPEGDMVYYDVEWGDGSEITDYGPWASGSEIELTHIYSEKEAFTIRARANDSFGYPGDWEVFKILIPKSKPLNINILESLFERFLLLKQLVNLLF